MKKISFHKNKKTEEKELVKDQSYQICDLEIYDAVNASPYLASFFVEKIWFHLFDRNPNNVNDFF